MEGHPLRFLTLVRHLARTEQPFICFSVSLCMDDLSLVVSTEEKEFQPLGKTLASKACVAVAWRMRPSQMFSHRCTWKFGDTLYLFICLNAPLTSVYGERSQSILVVCHSGLGPAWL